MKTVYLSHFKITISILVVVILMAGCIHKTEIAPTYVFAHSIEDIKR